MAKKGKKRPAKNAWADHLTQKAKAMNYPARSVFKLQEIQKKFQILKKNDQVLDLGCAPGSWLLYAARQVGDKGQVFGIDLKKVDIDLPQNSQAIQDNILQLKETTFLSDKTKLDVVLSDMAPATTGRKDVDAFKSFELCNMALTTAQDFLKEGGRFVCKIFQGQDFKEFEKKVKARFKDCKIFKPESCRKQSKEIYIIAKGKK
ncbi:MAG: RlmE family RNA methyltransferase [Desulfobacteraceae bacterium]|nr:RlmE family RNA methyltransferase [Desulfobacteraceae bacterium]